MICKILRFNAKGNYLGTFGYMGDGAGGFNTPKGIAIDKSSRVYVVEQMTSQKVQVFNRQGKFLYSLYRKGSMFSGGIPSGIAVDNNNLIYISCLDVNGSEVRIFRYKNDKK